MSEAEAKEWFWWSITGRKTSLVIPAWPAHSTVHKICPHIGNQTTDGSLTSILEVRQTTLVTHGIAHASRGTAKAILWALTRSPVLTAGFGAAATDWVPFGSIGAHPNTYVYSIDTAEDAATHDPVHRIDHMHDGLTGLLIWNKNVYSHISPWAGFTGDALYGVIAWVFNLHCRVRMVPTESYALNQLGHPTVQDPHTDDRPEEEHIPEPNPPRFGDVARALAYKAAGDFVTHAYDGVLEGVRDGVRTAATASVVAGVINRMGH